MGRLLTTVKEQESVAEEQSIEKTAVKKITRSAKKDKQLSIKVSQDVFNRFTAIAKAQGMSNNSAFNMIMTKYIRENADLLDD